MGYLLKAQKENMCFRDLVDIATFLVPHSSRPKLYVFNIIHAYILEKISIEQIAASLLSFVSVAEWSKACDSSSHGEIRAGSNPAADIFLFC